MKRIDGEKAFGRVDPGFERRIQSTFALLKSQKENEKMKKKIKFAPLIAAALLILMAGLALAASRNWGLRDFLQKRNTEYMLPEAEDMIHEPTDQHQEKEENAAASLTIGEILFDGTTAQFVVYVSPKDEKSLFVLPDSSLSDRLSDLGKRFKGETATIREYAEQNGKEAVYRLSFGLSDSPLFVNSIDCEIEEDGTMACHLIATTDKTLPETSTATLTCYMDDLIGGQSIKEYISFTISWSPDQVLAPVESTEQVIYEEFGVRIDRVTMSGTPTVIRLRIEMTVLDKEKYEAYNYPRFEFVGEDGKPLPMNLGMWDEDSFGPITNDDPTVVTSFYGHTRYLQKSTLPAAESLPKEVRLAVYDWVNDVLYPEQAQTVHLSQVER